MDTIAVSYTHLDVYKRQEQYSVSHTELSVYSLCYLMPNKTNKKYKLCKNSTLHNTTGTIESYS